MLYLYYLLVFIFIITITKFYYTEETTIKNKKILYLIAHPDDEIMFFYPSINNLIKNNNLHLICLSNGNYEKLGEERKEELHKVCKSLGIQRLEILNFIDHPELFWNYNVINELITDYLQKNEIDILITFDKDGISHHPNHISCFYGIKNIEKINVMCNETVSIYRKFLMFFDIFNVQNNKILFYNFNILNVIYYMCMHQTQLKWYRILFIIFSRYSYINSFQNIR